MAEAQQTSDIYGILLDRNAPRVLMLPDDDDSDKWTLPHIHLPDKRVWVPSIGVTCTEMRILLAADVTVLRNVYAAYSENYLHGDLIYVLENHSKNWTPPPKARWVDGNQLEQLPLAHPEHRAVIVGELQDAAANSVPKLRPPWAQPGWFKAASDWMAAQLEEHGYVLTAPIEQTKSWGISCLLRARTNQGNVYFKVSTSLPLFGNEPALLQALAKRYPDFVPAPLAIESTQRWMLMTDFGTELRSTITLEKYETAMQRFGQLQAQAVSAVEDLLNIGCLDRRLNILETQIDPLLNHEIVRTLMTADEIAQLRAIAPRLKAMCSELASYRVPYSLSHGDLHSGNITGETLLFFDWTDACIAHPFLDLSVVVGDLHESGLTGLEQVLDAYLRQWITYEPMDRLREMWRIALPLGALHQAVSYQHIVAILEQTSKQELVEGVRHWLRQVLRTIPE
jgi:aminoglycoside phosphotransferase (APT) family kinase protein